jgi:hypothetical protein
MTPDRSAVERRRAYVERVVAAAPPLTPAQRDALALLFRRPLR